MIGSGIADKVVIVTGGGSGMGRSMVKEFTVAGARVIALDINLEAARTTVSELERSRGGAGGRG